MNNESLELSSNSTNAGIKKNNKLIDLSSFVYNRNLHDKTVLVKMKKISVTIGIGSISNSDKDKETLLQLIKSNYSSLFDTAFIEEIETLSKEDLISICNYRYTEDTFSGIEFSVLTGLIYHHIDEFKKDIKTGNLNNVIQLSVGKDNKTGEYNLFVNLYPAKSTAKEPVLYVRNLLYLVLFHLYKQVNRHVYDNIYEYFLTDIAKPKYVNWVIKSVFTYIVPIVTVVDYQVIINADDNYTWFRQLQQLDSGYGFLLSGGEENTIWFKFRPKEEYLASTINFPVINEAPSDSNYIERIIDCTYTLNKDKTLTSDITLVGKDMVDSVFSTQMDEDNDPTPIFSRLSDTEDVYLSHYSILYRMLSFMEQHEKKKAQLRLKANDYVKAGKFKTISDISDNEKVNILTKINTISQAFKDIEVPLPDDKLFSYIYNELANIGQKNGLIEYTIIILEHFQDDKKSIDELLSRLDERTSQKIWKVIKKLRKLKLPSVYSLNDFYRGYC